MTPELWLLVLTAFGLLPAGFLARIIWILLFPPAPPRETIATMRMTEPGYDCAPAVCVPSREQALTGYSPAEQPAPGGQAPLERPALPAVRRLTRREMAPAWRIVVEEPARPAELPPPGGIPVELPTPTWVEGEWQEVR